MEDQIGNANTALVNSDFFEMISKLKLNIKLNPAMGLSGSRRSNAKGSSLEFSDFREYIPGDDLRRIDWNVYGRTDRLLIKLFLAEKEALFRIITDSSSSMDFGRCHKGKYASLLAAAVGYLALEKDRARLISNTKGGIVSSPVLSGRQSFKKIVHQLENMQYSKKFDLWNVIKKEKMQSNGITLIISDCYLEHKIDDVLKYLTYRKQTVVLFHVLSGEELYPESSEMDGTLRLIDNETDDWLKVTVTASVLKNYHQRMDHFLLHIRSVCKKYRVLYIPAWSFRPPEEPLMQLFRLKEGIF